MKLLFNKDLAKDYYNQSQRIRVLTEAWVDNEIFCPNCGNSLNNYENNKPVADFFCSKCFEQYELKSKNKSLGNKIVDGAYRKMIERLSESTNPNFFFLNYSLTSLEVINFLVIPKHFFVSNIIEKRNPLKPTAKRAGWVGCNILMNEIPLSGRIFYVKNGKIEKKNKVLDNWQKTLFLRKEIKVEVKGWLLDVMKCIDNLNKNEFNLNEVYAFEDYFKKKYPQNNYIKDKIRQQLQILRDKGYLKFIERGKYKII